MKSNLTIEDFQKIQDQWEAKIIAVFQKHGYNLKGIKIINNVSGHRGDAPHMFSYGYLTFNFNPYYFRITTSDYDNKSNCTIWKENVNAKYDSEAETRFSNTHSKIENTHKYLKKYVEKFIDIFEAEYEELENLKLLLNAK